MNNHSRSALHLGRNLLSFQIKSMVELKPHSSGGLTQFAADRAFGGMVRGAICQISSCVKQLLEPKRTASDVIVRLYKLIG